MGLPVADLLPLLQQAWPAADVPETNEVGTREGARGHLGDKPGDEEGWVLCPAPRLRRYKYWDAKRPAHAGMNMTVPGRMNRVDTNTTRTNRTFTRQAVR